MTCVRNKGQADWQGTHLSIRAIQDGVVTHVDLLHDGYSAKNACYDKCVGGWSHFFNSLRAYCETGRGMPYGSALHPHAMRSGA